MPYRDPRAVLVQRLAELDAERRDLAKRLALFAPSPRPSRASGLHSRFGPLVAALCVLLDLVVVVQTTRIGVRLPSGELRFLFDGELGTENVIFDLGR